MIKVVNPSVELWKQDGYDLESIFKHIAKCARVCYQSTPKNKDENAYDFLVRTVFKGHDFLKELGSKFVVDTADELTKLIISK